MCRPDILVCVTRLASSIKADGPECNVLQRGAAKAILRYLAHDPNLGAEYSPKIEADFNKIYTKVLDHHPENSATGKAEKLTVGKSNIFCDAGFAGCLKTLRSQTGIALYWRGCLIGWRTSRQSIRAASTCESEWIAMSDALRFENQEFTGLEEFLTGETGTPIWCDNRSACILARKQDSTAIPKKSKYYALRQMEVIENGSRVAFVPTHLQKSDALTKINLGFGAREMLFRPIEPPTKSIPLEEEETIEEIFWCSVFGIGVI